jgi:hypothetical protein
MPVVMRFDGFGVVIYPNDHRPAHVHVMNAEKEAVFNLNCPGGPVALRENYGYSQREIRAIRRHLDQNAAKLCHEWRRIHGQV